MKVDLEGLANQLDGLSHNKNLTLQEQGVVWVAAEAARELDRIENKPKRNYARFANGTDAWNHWNNFCIERKRTIKYPCRDCVAREEAGKSSCFAAWLYAKAEGDAE